jgi:ABC-type branched-subunit amino acid transport system substrate-binding protein
MQLSIAAMAWPRTTTDVAPVARAHGSGNRGATGSGQESLQRTRIKTGLLGEVRFDANGDPVRRPFTVLRFDFRRPPRWSDLLEDMAFDRIVVPRPELLRTTPAPQTG